MVSICVTMQILWFGGKENSLLSILAMELTYVTRMLFVDHYLLEKTICLMSPWSITFGIGM